jgi:hypothetical protein
MMEAVRTSETLVNFNVTTWRYIPEDSKLQQPILFTIILEPVLWKKIGQQWGKLLNLVSVRKQKI